VRRFENILGQQNVIRGLRDRVRSRTHKGGLILHGPNGVGKRTLANLFARALLCVSSDEFGSPCNCCASCQAFDQSSVWDFIEFDSIAGDPLEIARRFREEVRFAPQSGRRVIAIANADAYEARESDVFLKVLEETPTPTTFIFMASDLRSVSDTIRSRCRAYRLRPLGLDQMTRLANDFAMIWRQPCEDDALRLLAAAGKGLPGALWSCFESLIPRGCITVADVRQALDLEWPAELIVYWSHFLKGEAPPEDLRTHVMGHGPEEALRRFRVLVQHFYARELCPHGVDTISDAALIHTDVTEWRELIARFDERASQIGLDRLHLWLRFADSAISTDNANLADALVAALPQAQ